MWILNLVIPGSGLILRDRWLLGCCGVLASLLCVSVIIAGPLIMSPALAADVRLIAVASYLLLAVLAGLIWWRWEAATPLSQVELVAQHREITRTWLQGDEHKAQLMATRLVAKARRLPAVWDLLALVGTPQQQDQAQARAADLRRRSS